MPSFRTTHRVPFTARQMFDLVADLESYPAFLPLCEALVVRRRELLVMVEVRARGPRSYQGPFASVSGAKLGRLRLDIAAVDLWGPAVTIEVAEGVALG